PDHALHGRGGATVRPARRDGQGEDRRGGLPPGPHRAILDPRGDRAALPRGRAGHPRRPARRDRRADRAAARPGTGLCRGRRRGRGRCPCTRAQARDRAGAAVLAGGRVPAADRPVAHRMTAIGRSAGSVPSGAAPGEISWLSGIARVFEYRLMDYRRTYRSSIFNSFVGPALFLAAMGVGLGTYVDASSTAALNGVSYLAFLAPGLLAATAMQTASFEATFPIMGGLGWNRVYHAMYATPIRPMDIALGNLAWIGFRVLLVSSVFVLVTALFGAAASPMIVLAIPVGVLTGLAFAAPITAFSATQRNVNTFNAVFRFGITPL